MVAVPDEFLAGKLHLTVYVKDSRVLGELRCGRCEWQAQLTADTEDETTEFLIAQLVAHLEDQHAAELTEGR